MEQCQAVTPKICVTQELRLLNHELEMPPQEFAKNWNEMLVTKKWRTCKNKSACNENLEQQGDSNDLCL